MESGDQFHQDQLSDVLIKQGSLPENVVAELADLRERTGSQDLLFLVGLQALRDKTTPLQMLEERNKATHQSGGFRLSFQEILARTPFRP